MPIREQNVCPPDDAGLANVKLVAIGIAPTAHGRHLGVICRKNGQPETFEILHLAFHYKLVREILSSDYWWVEPEIPSERATHVAALCDVIAQRYSDGKLAYAFRYLGGGFGLGSGELLSSTGRGLSCATFVLAVFASLGIDILELGSWPSREEDKKWQNDIVTLGRRILPDAEDHWSYLSTQEQGCLRHRPEEVAIGAT
ncbi:MAG TPA: hypothetical protein VH560_06850, partial [Polyangia bacterium]|nr:hypothetical protein [Polyangia bacterium]